jgi:serine/threonine protein kinase
LGFGTFGQVAKCRNTVTGELVAIKVIKNKPAYLKQSSIEVEILKHVSLKKKVEWKYDISIFMYFSFFFS